MYCHLCCLEVSGTHGTCSGHRAARELVANALDRLVNHFAAGEPTEGTINTSAGAEKASVKTPECVSFCETCNSVYPIDELTSHYRQKNHAIASLSEQEFEELVQAYIGGELKETSDPSEDGTLVDEAETAETYTCHLCAIEVPRVFKAEHERGSRHRASRTFALAAARRARDVFAADRSGWSGDKPKFSGKMMRKLLRAYTGKSEIENTEEPESKSEPDCTKPEPKLTPKEYFTDILPFLPYIGTINTLYIDDTEFVTIKIGNETLKIHVNNLNGLYNIDGIDRYYMKCNLCDGPSNVYYSSMEQHDKCHVMSLGHIRNVMSPVDNVHLIRKIDNSHYICGLCNVHIYPNPNVFAYSVENHIFKDSRHSVALTEALERGKDFKETNDHMKIMIYTPPVPKSNVFKTNNQNKWTFGIPPQPAHCSGLFGTQNTGFGTGQHTNFGAQSAQNTFGSARPQQVGLGSGQNTFGSASAQQVGLGSGQNTFGGTSAQHVGLGSGQNTFGSAGPQQVGLGSGQHTFGGASVQKLAFGSAQNTSDGASPQQVGFGSVQNTSDSASVQKVAFGSAQNTFGSANPQQVGFGSVQNTSGSASVQKVAFGSAQNTFGSASAPKVGFSSAQSTSSSASAQQVGFGSAQNTSSSASTQTVAQNTSFSNEQNTGFGNTSTKNTFGVSQNVPVGTNQKNNTAIDIDASPKSGVIQNIDSGFSAIQTNSGAVQKTGLVFNTQKDTPSTKSDNESNSKNNNQFKFFTKAQRSPVDFKFFDTKLERNTIVDSQNKLINHDQIKAKEDGDRKAQRAEPPRRLNYSSSSSDSE